MTVDDQNLKWHVSFGMNYDAIHLDDRVHWTRQGIDPDEHVAKFRTAGDKQGAARGLIFIGEKRIGTEIQRQYVVSTIWWRLRFLVFKPTVLKPRVVGPPRPLPTPKRRPRARRETR